MLTRLSNWFASIDRSILFVVLLALLVVPARSAYIASAHSESIDDEYHLVRGVRFLRGELGKTPLNDPVLGETVIALPVWAEGATPNKDHKFGLVLHGQRVGPETLLMLVALWKSVLFVPFVVLVFVWVRSIYNAAAGWAAAVLMLIEPTIGAHVAPAALDVIGFEMIALSCWLWWRYFERPSVGRVVLSAVISAAALLTKHTAIVLPLVALGYAAAWMIYRRSLDARRNGIHAAIAIGVAVVALFVLSFDVSNGWTYYPRTLAEAMHHGEGGHQSWLLGQRQDKGSLIYYFVVAWFKVPVELMALVALGVASLLVVRPRFNELALLVPMLLLAALVIAGGINIGFRHAIPAYGLLLMLATRALLIRGRWIGPAVATLLAVTVLDVARFGPDLISYLNWPRAKPWLAINDSNLDWGQGLKEIRQWIDTHPKETAGKSIYVRAFGLSYSSAPEYYLGGRAQRLRRNGPVPKQGLLIVSPAHVVGLFEDEPDRLKFLRGRKPLAIIGHSNLVFTLD